LDVELSRCSPSQLLAEVVSVLRVRALEKDLRLEYTWSGAIPETIESDPARFRQVLMNLIGNAVKFTRQGYVRITARVDREPAEPLLVIDVEDSGIGIPAENCERIFSPFEQADSSVTREFGGTGLGLSISRRLVEMMRGRISVKSDPGRGSTFTIAIPTGPLENVRFLEAHSLAGDRGDVIGQESQVAKLPPARILLVDDGQTNRKLIGLILKRAGCTVETADNGRTALDLALTSQFDLVLMDMQMPVMDGYTASRRLRDAGQTVPIIALTAHTMAGDREKCLDAGCSDYLTKPINPEQMFEVIQRSLQQRTAATT
jgi:CheY-like chemotaxis protein